MKELAIEKERKQKTIWIIRFALILIRLVETGPSAKTIINEPISINFAANSFYSVTENRKKHFREISNERKMEEKRLRHHVYLCCCCYCVFHYDIHVLHSLSFFMVIDSNLIQGIINIANERITFLLSLCNLTLE